MTDLNTVNLLAIIGSARKDSVNRKLAEIAVKHCPNGASITIYETLGTLPVFNEEIDGDQAPPPVKAVRDAVAQSDGVILVTPEYNGTIPSPLKAALDWLSRPYEKSVFTGKPTAVIGASEGKYGGVWGIDDTYKSAKVAGASIIEDAKLAISTTEGVDILGKDSTIKSLVKSLNVITDHIKNNQTK